MCDIFSNLGCEYHNLHLFSYTISDKKLLSIGVLGIPIVVQNLDI